MCPARSTSLVALIAALATAASASAALVPRKASQLVTVYATGGCPIPGFAAGASGTLSQMVRSDGSVTAFTIPAKQVFVMTDVTITAANEPASDAILAIVAVGTAAAGAPVSTRFETVASSGTVTSTFAFPTGIAMKGTSVTCVEMLNLTHGGSVFPTATAHGFFAPDK